MTRGHWLEAVAESADEHSVASNPRRRPWTVGKQAHIRLTPEQYAPAVEAIGSVVRYEAAVAQRVPMRSSPGVSSPRRV